MLIVKPNPHQRFYANIPIDYFILQSPNLAQTHFTDRMFVWISECDTGMSNGRIT